MLPPRPKRPWDRTPPSERDYFDVLGEGLVVHRVPLRSKGPERGFSPPSAWIHIAPDGRIRAFTGKVEVGQGTRTALSLAVAEELRVPLERVELVMGDTDLCPWDMGTFGSRSMPDALPALREVAATARAALIERASMAAGGSGTPGEAVDGEVRPPGRSRGTPYAELVRGRREVVPVGPTPPLTRAEDWRVAGHPALDPHARDVVTGRRTFVSDLRLPAMHWGAILRPPRIGARLVRVDGARAEARPGVRFVREGEFAGVVAPSPFEARAALADVEAEWEESPQPREDEAEAFLRAHPRNGDGWEVRSDSDGDPDGILAHADRSIEVTYRTAYIAHVPLETRTAVAEWTGPRLTVWVGTQTPFRARDHVAEALGLAVEDVRVIVPYTGSGFGGKHGGDVSLAAARLARAAGAPVAVTFSREEEFRFGYFRPMALIDVRAAVNRDGRLAAWVFHNVNAGSAGLGSPYRVRDYRIDNELSVSPLPQGAYRSLAANTNNFAREVAIDELAGLAEIDPLAFRERNLEDERLLAVLRSAAERAGWSGWVRSAGRGHGLAVGLEKEGRVATVAEVSVGADRSVHVDRLVTAFEAGAIVHPENLRNQVEGAAMMAIGGALFESIHFRDGRILNPRLSQYRVPRFSDLPELDTILIDRKDLPPVGGGETPMIAVAPAIANAIFDASGIRRRALPLLVDGKLPRR